MKKYHVKRMEDKFLVKNKVQPLSRRLKIEGFALQSYDPTFKPSCINVEHVHTPYVRREPSPNLMYYSARLIFQSAHRLTDSLFRSFHAIDSKFINRPSRPTPWCISWWNHSHFLASDIRIPMGHRGINSTQQITICACFAAFTLVRRLWT